MAFSQNKISLTTDQPTQIIDITGDIKDFAANLESRGSVSGLVVVSSLHTTMGVVINEKCEALEQDIYEFFKKLAPPGDGYRHDAIAVDGRPNAHSHLLGLMIPSQVTLVVTQGKLELGTWQSIFAVELDGPRAQREVRMTFVGS
jgi:secondary thiamine-phosphate synthase enzyme